MSESTNNTASTGEVRALGDLTGKARMLMLAKAGAGFALLALVSMFFPGETHDKMRVLGLGYLTGFVFVLSISLGALFFVIIHHLTRAGWSVVVRRLAENMAGCLKYILIMGLPIILLTAVGVLYGHWMQPTGEHAELVELKSGWLNFPFFSLRMLVYFLVWIGIAHWYRTKSIEQDTSGDVQLTKDMQAYSGLALVLFSLSINFGSMDLIMSLSPTWYSTIFGVYYFGGSMIAFFAVMILLLKRLQSCGVLTRSVNVEHFHDLGKFMFGFTIFWAYIAYSQYMLQWYGAIPEEVSWFATRGAETSADSTAGDGWHWAALLLLVCHFLIPFPGLLSRWAKRWTGVLMFWACWMLFWHLFDMAWVVMPEYGAVGSGGAFFLVVAAIGGCLGLGGLWGLGLIKLCNEASLVPEQDPRLGESLAFENF